MRALVCREYGPPESLVIEDRQLAPPAAGQILVDVHAAGINFPDVLSIAGLYQDKTPPPFVPGNEAAGTVAAIGDGVRQFAVGDKVIAATRGNAFAEQCLVDQNILFLMPGGLDFDQAAGFAVTYCTSYHALKDRAQLEPGETLLVLGAAGGVGSTAVELGKAMGARVIAAASSDEKLEFARECGADETINYERESLKDAVKALTDGNGADVVYDPVGGEYAEQAFRATAWHGRYLVVGFASGHIPAFAANIALLKEASVVGVWWGTFAARHPKEQQQNVAELAALLAEGKIQPRITETYPLEEYANAFRAITERRARGKVVLRMR